MNCKSFQVWAGNAARVEGKRHAGHRTGKQLLSNTVADELHRRLVLASCVSLSPPQAAGLVHSAARPLPTRPASLGSCGGPIFSPKGGTRGKRARLALTGPSAPVAPWRALPTFPRWKVGRRRPFSSTFSENGFFSTKSPYNVENQPGTNCSRLALLCISDYSSSSLSTAINASVGI